MKPGTKYLILSLVVLLALTTIYGILNPGLSWQPPAAMKSALVQSSGREFFGVNFTLIDKDGRETRSDGYATVYLTNPKTGYSVSIAKEVNRTEFYEHSGYTFQAQLSSTTMADKLAEGTTEIDANVVFITPARDSLGNPVSRLHSKTMKLRF